MHPQDLARALVVDAVCPKCGAVEWYVQGRGKRPGLDDRSYEADAASVCCGASVGTIRAGVRGLERQDGDRMTPEEARTVHVNDCVRDDELVALETLAGEAEPGAWVVKDGRVVRYGGDELVKPESLSFIAAARAAIPRLVRGVRVLEDALRTARIEASSWKRTVIAEREQHDQALGRVADNQTGPIEDLEILIELAELGAERRPVLVREIRHWAAGKARHPGVYAHNVERARQEASERDLETIRRECRALLEELRLTKKEREAVLARAHEKAATP